MSETDLNTQLFVAINENDVDLAKKLLPGGANVHTRIEPKLYKDTNVGIASHFGGVVPLHFAVIKGNKEMVEVLLNNGADVNAAMLLTQGGRRTPLHLAVEAKKLEIAGLLLDRGAKTELKVAEDVMESTRFVGRRSGYTPLHCAIAIGDLVMAELLLRHGADVNAKIIGDISVNNTALQIAIEKSNLDAVKFLLDKKADPNIKVSKKSFYTPLHLATEKGNLEVVKLLLEHEADPNILGGEMDTPLYIAVENRNLGAIKLLLNKKADPNIIRIECGSVYILLHLAVEKENLEVITLLLEHGADINAKDKYGKIPLCYAVEKNKIDIAERIVKEIAKLETAGLYVSPENLELKAQVLPKIEERRFIHNHKPLIDALPKLGYNGNNTDYYSIKTFLEANKDKFTVKVGVQDKTLIDLVDFEDVRERHVPKLKFCAFAEVVKNHTTLDNLKTEQHQATGPAIN